ncbi:MAG: cupin domain-containing protein [Bacteroidetes bacterium]|nr:cupin domain-containing protein [Bacteroidota bacterium]MBK8874659.1 cupin domain-containing protein [Bacteroidota bacterium]MBK9048598.1 cupin domain-containing protein [Bacteroidota bacterium]
MKGETIKINKNGETLRITRSSAETNGQLTEFEGTDQPGIGPPMHVHFKQEEMIKVTKGKLRVKTIQKEFSLTEGESYIFAPGEAHTFWNEGNDTVHYSGYVKPSNNYEYFIKQIYQSANEANDDKPGPFDAAFLLTKYKSEMDMLVIPKPVKTIVFPILLAIGNLTGKFKKYKDAPAAVI